MRSSLLPYGAERDFPGQPVGVAPDPHWKYVSFVPETIERCEARAAL